MSYLYLSDDTEGRLRRELGEPCRSCRHLFVRFSPILDNPIRGCKAAGDNEVLGRVLVRLAESGRCDEAMPFELSDSVPEIVHAEQIAKEKRTPEPFETSVIGQFVQAMTKG